MELRRQHADDGVGGAAERNGFAEGLGIAMKAALEVGVRQDHDPVGAGALLAGIEQAAPARRHTEHREQVGGGKACGNMARMVRTAFGHTHVVVCGHIREYGVLSLPLQVILPRHLDASFHHWIGQLRQALP